MAAEEPIVGGVPEPEAVRLARELYGLEAAAREPARGVRRQLPPGHRRRARPRPEGHAPGPGAGPRRAAVRGAASTWPSGRRSSRSPGSTRPRPGSPSRRSRWRAPARLVWVLGFVPGTVLARARPHSPELLASLGRLLGEMDAALADFTHPAATRELKWDLARAGWIREHLGEIETPARRALVERVLARYEAEVVPALPTPAARRDPRRRQRPQRDRRRPARPAAGGRRASSTSATCTTASWWPSRRSRRPTRSWEGRPAGGGGRGGRGLPPRRPARGGGDRAPLPLVGARLAVSVTNSASCERHEARRPLRHDQRGPGLGGARAARRGPPAAGATTPSARPAACRRSPRARPSARWLRGQDPRPGPRRRPAHRPQPGLRPGRRQPLPRRRPARGRDRRADREDLRRDEEGGGRGRRRALRRGAGDLPLGALRRRRAGPPTSGARCTSASTSS